MFEFRLLVSAIMFVCLDMAYFKFFEYRFDKQVQDIQGSKIQINYLAVMVTYIFFIIGLNYFIIAPRRSITDAFLLGLVIYGVTDSTGWALFTKWPPMNVIMNTLWGGSVFALTTFIVKFLKL